MSLCLSVNQTSTLDFHPGHSPPRTMPPGFPLDIFPWTFAHRRQQSVMTHGLLVYIWGHWLQVFSVIDGGSQLTDGLLVYIWGHRLQVFSVTDGGSQLNMRGVFLHVLGDALGSVIVIISALVIKFVDGDWKFKVDPAMRQFTSYCSYLHVCRLYIQCVSEKVPTFKLSVSLSNLNRFSKFLHCSKAYEIC